MSRFRMGSFVLVVCASFSFSFAARAEGPPSEATRAPSPAVAMELVRFRAAVARAEHDARAFRIVNGLVGASIGAVAIPSGIALYGRDPSVGAGVVVGIGIASALDGLGIALAWSSPYAKIDSAISASQRAGAGDAAALEAGEHAWAKEARDERLERHIGGGVFLGLGLTALGLGTAFAASDLTTRTFDRREQDGVASALLVGGAAVTIAALASLFVPSAIEAGWDGYGAAKDVAVARPRIVGFGAGPLAGGGGSAGIVGAF